MNKYVYAITLIVLAGVTVSVSVWAPYLLAHNKFLTDFIEDQILNILAVIMTISIASIATIHIWFNELESKHDKKVFGQARREVNQSATIFIGLFVAEVALLIVRSFFDGNDIAISIFNGAAMLILLGSVFTLADLMGVVKELTPGAYSQELERPAPKFRVGARVVVDDPQEPTNGQLGWIREVISDGGDPGASLGDPVYLVVLDQTVQGCTLFSILERQLKTVVAW